MNTTEDLLVNILGKGVGSISNQYYEGDVKALYKDKNGQTMIESLKDEEF